MDYAFDNKTHSFYGKNLKNPDYPLTVTLQVTRRCNLNCIYCSENNMIPDPDIKEMEYLINCIRDVPRVIVSGGEPFMRKDIFEILRMLKKDRHILALATNATLITSGYAKNLSSLIDYADVTIDGPRKVHDKIRGHYDDILRGILNLESAGVEYSIVTVLLSQNAPYLETIGSLVNELGAKKHKILTPIPKGRGKEIYDAPLNYSLEKVISDLKILKEKNRWKQKITITDWNKIGQGHALLIHPNGDVAASPVFNEKSCIKLIGNLHDESIYSIWNKFPFKEEHFSKYFEKSLNVL
jgi:MoaA/NifB/PqqE/SkfB family radical SAM enzyme